MLDSTYPLNNTRVLIKGCKCLSRYMCPNAKKRVASLFETFSQTATQPVFFLKNFQKLYF